MIIILHENLPYWAFNYCAVFKKLVQLRGRQSLEWKDGKGADKSMYRLQKVVCFSYNVALINTHDVNIYLVDNNGAVW